MIVHELNYYSFFYFIVRYIFKKYNNSMELPHIKAFKNLILANSLKLRFKLKMRVRNLNKENERHNYIKQNKRDGGKLKEKNLHHVQT